MTEVLKQIIGDIREDHRYELRRIQSAWLGKKHKVTSMLRDVMKMTLDPQELVYSINHPIFPEQLGRLEKISSRKPEWTDGNRFESKDYPDNIVRWIGVNLDSWGQGDLLGRYLPEHRAAEGYWLSIVLKARQLKLDCRDLGVIVLINQLAKAFIHIGNDADDQFWKTMPEDVEHQGRRRLVTALSQYWTHYVVFNFPERNAELLDAFLRLMADQPIEYRGHLDWLESDALAIYANYGITPELYDGADRMFLTKPIRESVRRQMLRQRDVSSPYDTDLFTVDLERDEIAVNQAMVVARERHGELGPFIEKPA